MAEEIIYTWATLNPLLMNMTSEKQALALYEQQKALGAKPHFLNRIWSRYSRLRSRREKQDLQRGKAAIA